MNTKYLDDRHGNTCMTVYIYIIYIYQGSRELTLILLELWETKPGSHHDMCVCGDMSELSFSAMTIIHDKNDRFTEIYPPVISL